MRIVELSRETKQSILMLIDLEVLRVEQAKKI